MYMAITTTTIVAANDNIYLYRTGIWTTTVYDDPYSIIEDDD